MSNNLRKIIFAAAIAAMYVVMTVIFHPISYGPFQFRISEVLMILPFFFPVSVPGLFIGCFIANLFGPYTLADGIVGSTATLIAALITMQMGKSRNSESATVKALSLIPPVIVNAIFIGALISVFMVGAGEAESFWTAFVLNAIQVGFGQSVVLYLIGLPLLIYLPRIGVIDALKQIYERESKEGDDGEGEDDLD